MRASAIWDGLTRLLADPPPGDLFEVSARGIAAARLSGGVAERKFTPLADGVLTVTPLRDNVTGEAAFQAAVNALSGAAAGRRRRAALILPDYCSRVTVLDFEAFPSSAAEQAPLIRFRLKKTVPFDIDAAALSYHTQPAARGKGRVEVVAAVTPLEILARYETPFRAAGFHPGLVTTSLLAALRLVKPGGVALVAKLSGRVLTLAVIDETAVRLVRCVELEHVAPSEIEPVLLPTLPYIEDELGRPATRLLLCGFGAQAERWGPAWAAEWGMTLEIPGSHHGLPGEDDAGLLGLLEGAHA